MFSIGSDPIARDADLLEACAQAKQPIVELDELVSADAFGIDALFRIEQQGARLVGLPEYLRLTLETLALGTEEQVRHVATQPAMEFAGRVSDWVGQLRAARTAGLRRGCLGGLATGLGLGATLAWIARRRVRSPGP